MNKLEVIMAIPVYPEEITLPELNNRLKEGSVKSVADLPICEERIDKKTHYCWESEEFRDKVYQEMKCQMGNS